MAVENSILVDGIWKRYRLNGGGTSYNTLRDKLSSALTAPFRVYRRRNGAAGPASRNDQNFFWALQDLSFHIRRGEAVAIIGHNGAGKSTLLRILSQISEPTRGYAEVRGRVGALLEVGTGFHGELTGRENIFLSGSILGLRRGGIKRKFDDIVAFAGVENFIDTPVKHYSTGMYLRLAFGVAAHLEPDILIVDEILAVGDAAFQRKCLGKMGEVAKEGRTVLLVSHNMGLVSQLTERAMILEAGQLKFFGRTRDAVSLYLSNAAERGGSDLRDADRPPRMTPTLLSARILDERGSEKTVFQTGDDWFLEVDYAGGDSARLAGAAFDILTASGVFITRFETYMRAEPPYRIPRRGTIRFHVAGLPLCEGEYLVSLGIGPDPCHFSDRVQGAVGFSVQKSDLYQSGFMITHEHGLCAFPVSYEILPPARDRHHRPGTQERAEGPRRRRGVSYLPVVHSGHVRGVSQPN